MKKKLSIPSLLFLPLLLASCTGAGPEDYIQTLAMERDDFRILQLTDIHWSLSTNIPRQKEYMDILVEHSDPDLIVITGDALFTATKNIAAMLYDYIDSLGIPYGVVYGNHDMQGMWSSSWMDRNIVRENAAFRIVQDDMQGRTNWAINIEKNDEIVWQVIGIDSNSYMADGLLYQYDYIHDDQVSWFQSVAEEGVPSIGFLHIPLWEYAYAYEENPEGIIGELREPDSATPGLVEECGEVPFYPSSVHSAFFEAAKDAGMRGIFAGHDHSNDWVGMYEGVALGYGVKCGRELYYGVSEHGYDLTGAALYTLGTDESLQITHMYLDNTTMEFTNEITVEVAR